MIGGLNAEIGRTEARFPGRASVVQGEQGRDVSAERASNGDGGYEPGLMPALKALDGVAADACTGGQVSLCES